MRFYADILAALRYKTDSIAKNIMHKSYGGKGRVPTGSPGSPSREPCPLANSPCPTLKDF
jgi:hypothetical protein